MSVAFAALPAHSAPAPANSVIASFLIGFSLLVAALWLKDLPPHLFPRKPKRKSKEAGTTQRRVPLSARSLLRAPFGTAQDTHDHRRDRLTAWRRQPALSTSIVPAVRPNDENSLVRFAPSERAVTPRA